MNPVLILTHNCLELTKRCVESIRNQDIQTEIMIYDNGSTDSTEEWLADEMNSHYANAILLHENKGVSVCWNSGLNYLFNGPRYEHVLVINNDTTLPPWFYRRLLELNLPFVTGVSVGSHEEIATEPTELNPIEAPDFSAYLIRKAAWDRIGRFDEHMVMYCQDLDYHIRAWRAGIHLMNAQLPFYHERSSTLKQADPRERRLIEMRADADREILREKWGCFDQGPTYKAQFAQELFGTDQGQAHE